MQYFNYLFCVRAVSPPPLPPPPASKKIFKKYNVSIMFFACARSLPPLPPLMQAKKIFKNFAIFQLFFLRAHGLSPPPPAPSTLQAKIIFPDPNSRVVKSKNFLRASREVKSPSFIFFNTFIFCCSLYL